MLDASCLSVGEAVEVCEPQGLQGGLAAVAVVGRVMARDEGNAQGDAVLQFMLGKQFQVFDNALVGLSGIVLINGGV